VSSSWFFFSTYNEDARTDTYQIILPIYTKVFHVKSFPSGLPTGTMYALLLYPILATCPAHVIVLELILRRIFVEEYRL
jgi:hypothetical protein